MRQVTLEHPRGPVVGVTARLELIATSEAWLLSGSLLATQDGSVLPENCLHKTGWIPLSGLPTKIGEPAIRISENLAMAYTKTPCGSISEGSHMSSKTPLEFLANALHFCRCGLSAQGGLALSNRCHDGRLCGRRAPGHPGNESKTVLIYLYQTAWSFFRMGYASAMAVSLAGIMIVVTLIQFALLRNREA